ncbi:MAG: signal recognition particle-docking protein FtsY [Pseudonocardiaceae bacterium]
MVTSVIWISIAIAVVLLVALAVGLLLARRRRISIAEKPEQQVEAPAPPRRYQAGGSISFSSGGGGPPAAPKAPAPPQASAPAPPKPPAQAPPAAVAPQASAPAPPKPPVQAPPAPAAPKPKSTTSAPAPPAELDSSASVVTPAPIKPVPVEPARAEPVLPEPAVPEPALPEPALPEPALPEPAAAPLEPIDAPAGRLVRLRGRLARSRSAFGQSLLGLLGAGDLDEDSWTDVEDTLLLADLGAATTTEIVDRLRAELAARGVRTAEQARVTLRDVLIEALRPELDRAVRALPHTGADGVSVPGVVLIAGVNGTGKTTTTGKLARVLVADGRRVLLGAADTFRAAAVEQLATWGERAGAEVVRGAEGADPASVAFEAVKRGGADGVDTVLIDTAGRLHTKTGLMDELGKIKRVVSKQAEVDEVLLVLDATTGQNGMVQARVFREVVEVTGIVLTKLDGTAKGGIVFHVQRELGVPVKLVGLGEGVDDLAPFEPAAFVDALLE